MFFKGENRLLFLPGDFFLRRTGLVVPVSPTGSSFIALRWVASNFAAIYKVRRLKLHGIFLVASDEGDVQCWNYAYSCRGNFLFVKPRILLALPAASLHCWKNLRLDAIVTPRSMTHCTHSILTPFISERERERKDQE